MLEEGCFYVNLLSAPLTIPLVCCHIKHFRRAVRCGEAMARRRKEEQWAGLASRGMCSDGVVAPTVWCLRGATPRGQPWTSAVPLSPGRHGLGARRMAVLSTFRALALGRHVHREF